MTWLTRGLTFLALVTVAIGAWSADPKAAGSKLDTAVAEKACEARKIPSKIDGAPDAFADCAGAPVMVALPGGGFLMGNTLGTGSAYEKPPHDVQVRGFAIARYEVTRSEWAACIRAGGCPALASEASDALPVTDVSWEQAQLYIRWLSQRTRHRYRLPTEAEWEYAARAGTVSQYSWGSDGENLCRYANGFDASGRRANPQWYWGSECDDGNAGAGRVGQFPPNAWGLHDMLGNVWEWVEDCWHSDYTDAPTDGSAWVEPGCPKRVNRGGGWGNPASSLRITNRDGDPANGHGDGLGFRVARDLSP
ncbi:formylglycine-generating enzyme family protein [Hydrocarboniphaga effusa]|uniref:formylglycine-generating enzyme family protein n=1 Tax=Hydrocarboniphaga effusa TaxID=243629 RepID=UPI00398BF355